MKWMMPMLVVMSLSLMAWPVLDEPAEPALEFVDVHTTDWTGQRPAWAGDDAKRNAILMSAVWAEQQLR